jgi:penicillin amidase
VRLRILAAAVVLAVAVPSVATSSTKAPFDHVVGGNVTPPGNNGHIPAPQLAAALAGTYSPPNSTDQRDLYVNWGRKGWAFSDEADLDNPIKPDGRTDVRIYVDDWGVPKIFGDTDRAAQFGVGYAMASQRLFQADVFRHVARGEMAEFLGGQVWYDYDREWRKTFYTDHELMVMFRRAFHRRERRLVKAYLAGVNTYIEEAMTDPQKMPAEYAALGVVPEEWELRHALAVFVLQARDSVEGFGQELDNAILLQDLQKRLGDKRGSEVFRDIRFIRDPGAYTTAPRSEGRFRYPGGGFEGLNAPGVAMPDKPGQLRAVAAGQQKVATALTAVGLNRKQASNAITVTRGLSDNGRPLLLGGPQLDYLVPGIFWEFEVHGRTQHARGIGFAGTAGVVLIGKSPTHTWTITYGYTDQVDNFLVPLDPKRPDTHYKRRGESKPLQTYNTTVTCKADQTGALGQPGAEDTCDGAPADQTEITVKRVPAYGPVVGRVQVGGKPYAVVRTAAHWKREIANGRPFITLNKAATRDKVRDAVKDFTVSLNINYVDDRGHAGFWHVARPPIRAEGTDVRLPTLGTGRYDWKGVVPPRRIPHAINPDQGYTVNWNNQVGKGWHNGDSNYWAAEQRVNMLARRMKALAARGDIRVDDLWRVNREAAFQDARLHDALPFLRKAFRGHSPENEKVRGALTLVRRWNGMRTSSKEGDTWVYRHAATLIWDRFFALLQREVLHNELGDENYDRLVADLEVDFYYLAWPLLQRILEGRDASLPPKHDWLDGAGVNGLLRDSFKQAVRQLSEEMGGKPSSWHGPAAMTNYRAVGLGSVDPHPFMNRGTYNELASVRVVPRHLGPE